MFAGVHSLISFFLRIMSGCIYYDSNWDTDKYTVMKKLIVKKFTGNEELKTELMKTGTKTLVECGRDVNYACGLPITHKDIFSKTKWTGKNKLGDILCEVRSNIK